MSDLLGIGASGVRAYQSALSAVGSNVSNADTPGYTRRSVTLQENTSTNASQLGYINNDQFGGVLTADVTRAWDDYQAAAARTAGGEAGSADTRQTWLSNAETALNDSATGVGQSATAFFNAGDALAADAGSTGNRKAFLGALDQTASAFRQTAGALASVSTGIATAAQTTVQTVNADLDALDKVNAQLRNQAQGSSQQADLMDQRDRLLDDISGNVGINVSVAGNGVATVTIASSGLQLTGGVDGNGSGARFAIATGNNGALSLQAFSSGKSQVVGDAGGTLGGFVTSASVVADRRNSLDQMATSFAAAVNAWQAQGTDGNGNAGAPLLGGTSASTLQITTSDPTAVAAASGGASNGNLLTLASLRGQSGLEQTWDGMVTDQGQMVSAVNSESTAADSAKQSAFGARDANTGVDLNTEAAEMIRYQQAYNGAAKVIQVAKDTLQSILDLFLKAGPMLNTQYSLTAEIQRQQTLASQIAQLQTDISSTVKVHVASDDPQAAARIAQIGRQQADQTTYATNVKQGQAITALVDTNLQSVQTAIGRVKELMLQASNGTMNADDRTAAITEMQGIASDLKTYAAQTDSSGNPLYAAGSPTQIPIGDGTTVAAAESYDQVFGSVTLKDGSTTSIDDIVSNAITALQTTDDTARGTAAAASLDALDAASTHISDEQSDLGVREGRFNAASDALADSATNLKVERSGLEDTDITDAYATMSNKMTILNAAQSVLAQINKISLFDKIS